MSEANGVQRFRLAVVLAFYDCQPMTEAD